jgi:hypothetical protein
MGALQERTDGRSAPRGEGSAKIGEPGTRSDGRPCPYQIVNREGQVLAGYETRHGAESDVELYARSAGQKKPGYVVRRTATALLPGIEDKGQLPAVVPAAAPAGRRAGGRR